MRLLVLLLLLLHNIEGHYLNDDIELLRQLHILQVILQNRQH